MAVVYINGSRAAFVQSFDRRAAGGGLVGGCMDSVLVCTMLVFQSNDCNDLTIQRTGNNVVGMSPSRICS